TSDTDGEPAGTNVFCADVRDDGSIGAWRSATPLPESVFDHAGIAANGFLYVLGGIHYFVNGDELTNTVYYSKIGSDASLGPWQTTTPLPQTMDFLSAAAWSKTLYIVGGGNE